MRLAPGNEARFVQDVAGRGFPSLVVTRNAFDWILGMHRLSHHARWMERLSLEEYVSTRAARAGEAAREGADATT